MGDNKTGKISTDADQKASEADKNKECTICLGEITKEEGVLKCNHSYCFSCIEGWSKRENTCPLCKAKFTYINKYDLTEPNPTDKRKKGRRKPIRIKVSNRVQQNQGQFNIGIDFPFDRREGFLPQEMFALVISLMNHRHDFREEVEMPRPNRMQALREGRDHDNPIILEDDLLMDDPFEVNNSDSNRVIDLTGDDDEDVASVPQQYSPRVEYNLWSVLDDIGDYDDEEDDNWEPLQRLSPSFDERSFEPARSTRRVGTGLDLTRNYTNNSRNDGNQRGFSRNSSNSNHNRASLRRRSNSPDFLDLVNDTPRGGSNSRSSIRDEIVTDRNNKRKRNRPSQPPRPAAQRISVLPIPLEEERPRKRHRR